MAAKTKKKPSIDKKQWNMPVSFREDGKTVTLREFIKGGSIALSLSSLDEDQRAELTAQRIQMQSKFELGMIGVGVVDKNQAIAEVKNKTSVGRTLIEIETRVIQHAIEQAKERTKK